MRLYYVQSVGSVLSALRRGSAGVFLASAMVRKFQLIASCLVAMENEALRGPI
jgi:hypothetical protein